MTRISKITEHITEQGVMEYIVYYEDGSVQIRQDYPLPD